MTRSLMLGDHYEAFIEGQLATGRYRDASEVVRDALRLMEARERHRVVEAAIEEGLADIADGRVRDADAVFDDLEAELAAMPETRHA